MNLEKEQAVLERLTTAELRGRYLEVFKEPTRAANRTWLVRRILWRLQANAEGDLSTRAQAKAVELANDADLRVTAPRQPKRTAAGEERTKTVATTIAAAINLLPGSMITREYKGRTLRVTVLADGFEFEGERYKSLTAVATAVTGTHWNGRHFFGLRKAGGAQ